jgi:hypothetical protein
MQKGNDSRPAGCRERIDAAKLRWRRALSWCPLEYLPEYHRLRRSKRMLAQEARQAIEDMIAADARRYERTGQLQQAVRG